jgi:hypothetical protein
MAGEKKVIVTQRRLGDARVKATTRTEVNMKLVFEEKEGGRCAVRDFEVEVHFRHFRRGALALNLKSKARLFIYLEISAPLASTSSLLFCYHIQHLHYVQQYSIKTFA